MLRELSPEMFSEQRFPASEFAPRLAFLFCRKNLPAVLLASALALVPCFWHRHIQAGDLGSHVYNAWLAQLIERGQVSGLTVVRQWDNVLFDLLLLRFADHWGFLAAEKAAVSLAVLVVFWGSFAFLGCASERPPWRLAPFLLVLAYGYVFHMGFMNCYLSIGLAFFGLAAMWRGGAGNWAVAAMIGGLSFLAHPIGFALLAGLALYVWLRRLLPGWWRVAVPLPVVGFLAWFRWFIASEERFVATWRAEGLAQLLGQDQMNVYGHRYEVLSTVALAWGALAAAAAVYDWVFRDRAPAPALRVAAEFYAVAFLATALLPENCRIGLYAGWVGLLVSRLTLVTAVFGLLVLACLRLPRWSLAGTVLCAATYFVFLHQDTGKLDRMEADARAITQALPPGTRVVAVANAPEDWRVAFIYHSIDRACIGRCFSFANYEPSSLQFRVRALPGSAIVSTSVDQSDDMSSGDYRVASSDLPLLSIYQCDDSDFTRLCALPLRAGQKTEDPESDPLPLPPSDPEN
jgi:hypothetical protein